MTAVGISTSNLPPNATLLDQPPTLWRRHEKKLIAGATLLLTILSCGILYLALSLKRSRRLNAIFDAMPISIAVVNRKNRIRFLRSSLRSELRRCRFFTELPSEIQDIYQKPLERVFNTHHPETLEYSYRGRQRRGEVLFLDKTIFGEECVLWISSDIEELHNAHQRLASLADRLRLVLNSIGDGVIATDEHGNITQTNPVASRLTGYAPTEMNGRKLQACFKLVDAVSGQPHTIPVESTNDSSLDTQINLIAKDGYACRIAGSAAPIETEAGVHTGNVLIFRDITEECAKREELNKQNTLLQTAAEIANMTYFSCDEHGNLLSTPDDTDLWGKDENGQYLSYRDWIAPESRPLFRQNWRKLRRHEIDSFQMSYAAGTPKTGKRFYEMRLLRRNIESSQQVEFFVIVPNFVKTHL